MSTRKAQHPIDQSSLYMLRSKRKLADILGISTEELRALARGSNALYSEFGVEKKDGSIRDVENPRRALKIVQTRIARLLSRIKAPEYLFCPVKGRCYVTNAAKHRGNRTVKCLDVRKYFQSTTTRRVYWFFNKILKCEPDVAATLANVATYDGHLPTGSPLSPILSYFAFYDVWENISDICLRHGYTMTVYMDDITISGRNISPAVMWEIKRSIHRCGLRYHKEKSYRDSPAEITGVIVSGTDLLPPNRQLKKLHEAMASLERPLEGDDAHGIKGRLAGYRGQIAQIKSVGTKLI